jgi:hypothetical protein
MSYPTCDHLKQDGVFCSSPALHNQRYCYFHLNARARRVQAARARLRGDACRLQLPVLDDIHSVQASLMQVLDALANDGIDNKRAGLMLYALQQVASNLKSTPCWDGARPEVEVDDNLRALECRSLEEQYDLPFDTDLESPPDVAAQELEANAALPPEQHTKKAPRPALARYRHETRDLDDDGYDRDDDDQPDGGTTYDSLRSALHQLQSTSNPHALGGPQLPSSGNCGNAGRPTPAVSNGLSDSFGCPTPAGFAEVGVSSELA